MSYWKTLTGRWGSSAGETDEIRMDSVTNTIQTITDPHHKIHSGNHFYVEGYTSLDIDGTLYIKLVTPNTGYWSHFVWLLGSTGILTTTFDEDATGGMTGGAVLTTHANNRNTNCWVGRHTGSDDEATVLTDSGQAWTIDALIGYQVFNTADGSSGVITDNTADTVTVAALAGGTGNDFDTGDEYEINKSRVVITSGVITCTDYLQRINNNSFFGAKIIDGEKSREDELILKQNTTYCRSFTSGTESNVVSYKASWYEHTNLN